MANDVSTSAQNLSAVNGCVYFTGLSKYFVIPLVPGLVHSQMGKSEAINIESCFYSLPSKSEKLKLKFVTITVAA